MKIRLTSLSYYLLSVIKYLYKKGSENQLKVGF